MNEAARFEVSLRIWHPHIHAGVISEELSLVPTWSYSVGEQRTTPKGQALSGVNKVSFWLKQLEIPDKKEIGEVIEESNQMLTPKRTFLRSLRDSDGHVEYFVGWFLSGNAGLKLKQGLMGQLADLGVDLDFDVYP